MKLPKLMIDDSENDGHAETVMDYVISWCLRCAMRHFADVRPILHGHCNSILCRLLGINNPESVSIIDVKVWKQESKIDLWVEISLLRNDVKESHALLIENKYYSPLRDNVKDEDGEYRNQLIVYKKKFDKYYDSQTVFWDRHYSLITCIERDDPEFFQYNICKKIGFELFSFYELRGNCTTPTESDIYNEFWLRW